MIDKKYLVSAGFDPGTFSTTQARWRRFSQMSHATIYNIRILYSTFLKCDCVIVEYETWLMNVTSADWGRYFNVIRPTVRWETAQDCEQCCLSASQSCCTCRSLGPELCTGFKQPSHWVGTAPRKGRSCLAISWAGKRWETTTTARKIYVQNNWLKKPWIFSYVLFLSNHLNMF